MHPITYELVKYHQSELLDDARRLHGFRIPTVAPFVGVVTAAIERARTRGPRDTLAAPATCAVC